MKITLVSCLELQSVPAWPGRKDILGRLQVLVNNSLFAPGHYFYNANLTTCFSTNQFTELVLASNKDKDKKKNCY